MIFAFLGGSLAGLFIVILISRLSRASQLAEAESAARLLIDEAKEEAQALDEELKLAAEEAQAEVYAEAETQILEIEARVRELDDRVRKTRSQIDREFNQDKREIDDQVDRLRTSESQVRAREDRLRHRRARIKQLRQSLLQQLEEKSEVKAEELLAEMVQKEIRDADLDAKKKAALYEEEIKADAEIRAKHLLTSALSRFSRPAPTERGIGIVEIPNSDVRARMLGPNDENIRELERLTGVSLSVTEKQTFQLASFDPMGREITTRTLEKLLHEKSPNVDTVRRLHEKTSGEVLRRVENDGNKIAAELGCRDLNPAIKRRLGELRYRYSFSQNQHFHVAEVGWLCGLLASELGGNSRHDAKRAGLLHDVGKAMDHAKEGGHAVIGAEFIADHGEKAEIVHAVRAHHYEEQPATDLAYLVIAADAISGARPGARRATVTAYNQKIEVLSHIAEDFPGVTKTLIFNAGREVRVHVDSRRVSDKKALELCRKIADKIEEECTYPGQIKVMLVRETHAETTAR